MSTKNEKCPRSVHKRPLSIKRIAERNNVTWKTANANISRLEKKGFVKCSHGLRRNYCKVTSKVRKLVK